MTLKEYLAKAILLDRAINVKLEQVRQLKLMASHSTSFISANNTSSTGSRVESLVEKIITKEEEINQLIDRYVDEKSEITALLSHIENIQIRTITEAHYLCGKTWEDVAEENYISIRTAHNMHKAALDVLSEFYTEQETA